MNFLPIVGRELRVAARKRSTFWLRVVAAVVGLLIGVGFLLITRVYRSGASQVGQMLFHVLTWLCLVTGLTAGLFFTSDCLSEEKREGTLGLLFLTDLRGYDVTLGKLLATSLRGFYALLAVFPIMATTLLLGGISADQYWKGMLALVNALFLSLATGMAVSAVSRDSQRAMTATLFILLLLAACGPMVDGLIAGSRGRTFVAFWSLASPAFVLVAATTWGRTSYWDALIVTQIIGWVMLALACVLVPHTWQDRKRARAGNGSGVAYAWRYGGAKRRARVRQKLVGTQPVAWLACRERWQSQGLWAIGLLLTGGLVAVQASRAAREYWMIWSWVGALFVLILYLWTASQASRFFVEARRSGLLELLLATPLTERQMIAGQWQALLRMFGLPVLLLLSVHLAGTTLSQMAMQRMYARSASMSTTTVTNANGSVTSSTVVVKSGVSTSGAVRTTAVSGAGGPPAPSKAWQLGMAATTAATAIVTTGANLLALCWFGMWMGLTSRTANLATLKTILFVQVIPWLVLAFTTAMLMGLVMSAIVLRSGAPTSAPWFTWWPLISTLFGALLSVAKDIGFILWSRKKLYASLREEAARSIGQPRFAAPLPLAAPLPAPPLIAARQ